MAQLCTRLVAKAAGRLGYLNRVGIRNISSLPEARNALSKLGGEGSIDLDFTSLPYVAVLTLNNPKRANAISCKMMLELSDAIAKLQAWKDGRAVIVKGSGSTFCAGADLSGGDAFFAPDNGAAMNAVMVHATRALNHLPLISVAAIEGAAVGGGAELATCCDYRIMADTATLQFVHLTRGVTPGWGGITRLVELCGRKSALYLLASGIKVDAPLAAVERLADAIVQPSEQMPIVQHAAEFLRPLLHVDNDSVTSKALHEMKQAITNVAVEPNFQARYQHESQVFRSRWGGTEQMDFMARWKKAK